MNHKRDPHNSRLTEAPFIVSEAYGIKLYDVMKLD